MGIPETCPTCSLKQERASKSGKQAKKWPKAGWQAGDWASKTGKQAKKWPKAGWQAGDWASKTGKTAYNRGTGGEKHENRKEIPLS